MRTKENKLELIALRARGLSLGDIAEELNVPRSTLGRWEQDCEAEILRLQRVEWRKIEANYAYSIQDDLERIIKRIRAAEDELDKRKLEYFDKSELFQLIREYRREYQKRRAILMTPEKMVQSGTSSPDPSDMQPSSPMQSASLIPPTEPRSE